MSPRNGSLALAAAGILLGMLGAPTPAPAGDARAPRAEVQINLCSEPQEIVRALALEAAAGAPTQVWYFDNADLVLARRGVVVRLRLKSGEAELTLKVADQDCARGAAAAIPKNDGKCEYDLHGSHLKGAVSLSRSLQDSEVQDLLAGRRVLTQVLSGAQVGYLRDVLYAWPLPDALLRLGPAYIENYRSPMGPFVVEMWRLPSGRRFVELSQKTGLEAASGLQATLADALRQAGVQVCEDQASQARIKLEDLLRQ